MIVIGELLGSITVHDIPLPSLPSSQEIDLSEVPLPPEPPLPPCPPVPDDNLVRLVTAYIILSCIGDFWCIQHGNGVYRMETVGKTAED